LDIARGILGFRVVGVERIKKGNYLYQVHLGKKTSHDRVGRRKKKKEPHIRLNGEQGKGAAKRNSSA